MARQQAARRPIEVRRTGETNGGGGNSDAPAMLRFEPELAVQAIAFHLADEGISGEVVADSAQATVIRLRRAGLRPTVARTVWSHMTNPQRLEWLLEQTATLARLIDDERSVLEPFSKN
jgi:hypothetical protein